MSDNNDTGPITHAEAREIANRYNNSHWRDKAGHEEHARYTIPADPRRDDDLRLAAYIDQCEARDKTATPKPTAPSPLDVGGVCECGVLATKGEYCEDCYTDVERFLSTDHAYKALAADPASVQTATPLGGSTVAQRDAFRTSITEDEHAEAAALLQSVLQMIMVGDKRSDDPFAWKIARDAVVAFQRQARETKLELRVDAKPNSVVVLELRVDFALANKPVDTMLAAMSRMAACLESFRAELDEELHDRWSGIGVTASMRKD